LKQAESGVPEIFNTPSRGLQANPCRAVDQGSQFTSYEFTQVLKDADVKISMGGRGRWIPLVDCKQSPAGSGQSDDRAPLAIPEIRMRLPTRL